MEVFITLLVIAGIAVIIPLTIAHHKKVNAAWAAAARQLGLRFTPASFGKRRSMKGRYRETYVIVDTYTQSHGKSSTTYTRFKVELPAPLGLGLNLKSEGFFSGLKKALVGRDIEVGDRSFDDAVLVRGKDQEAIVAFLTPARRVRIHRFLASHRGAVIRDERIEWSRTGTLSTADSLTATLRGIVELALSLSGVRKADKAIERALEARNVGRLEDALAILAPAADAEAGGGPPGELPAGTELLEAAGAEEKLMEGELLYLADRRDEAKEAFEAALAADPEDAEIRQWVEEVSAPGGSTGDAQAAAPESEDLDVNQVCAALFPSGGSSFEASRLFETRFQAQAVRWSGVLVDCRKYSYDYVFGSGGGAKASIEIGEAETTAYGPKRVLAIVQLPEAAAEELRDRVGETVVFRGVLKKADGFMRNLFVADGSVE